MDSQVLSNAARGAPRGTLTCSVLSLHNMAVFFYITKIVSALILPPGLIVVALTVVLVLMGKSISRAKEIRWAFVLLVCTAVCVYLSSITPVADMLIRPLENRYEPLSEGDASEAEAIVVLGGGILESSPEYDNRGSLLPDALKRLVFAAQLSSAMDLPIVVSGGKPLRKSDKAEADVAADTLISLGIPNARIFKEGRSRNTWENARFVSENFSYRKVVIVTSAYHMVRSVRAFKNNGFDVIPAPTDYKSDRGSYQIMDFFPDVGSFYGTYRALHEYIGVVFYALRYRSP